MATSDVDESIELTEGEGEPQSLPFWLEIAHKELGVYEIPGAGQHNPRILEYHSSTSLHATSDEIPWCSAFVCWCLEKAGIRSTRSAAARSFLDWGDEVDDPQPGDIVVFWRGSPDGWQGHVAFYWSGLDARRIYTLGGNEHDEVSIVAHPKSRILGYRRPKS